ncbi:hypothetical protein [Undibacterium sp. SXout20W]|uniref:hypothetical protein n=1 Tax=Undibacterium sp. SXout20W TaxID=3413051 RepID=UPI003BF12F97
MSISSINTSGFTSEAGNLKADPLQVKKAVQQNHDVKNAVASAFTPAAKGTTQAQAIQPSPLIPSINTDGQTVGQFISIKA